MNISLDVASLARHVASHSESNYSKSACDDAFLSRVSILLLTRDIDIPILSVCPSVRPSVCLSVTRWYCMKTAQIIVIDFSPYGSPIIPVLRASNISRNSDGVTPCGGAKYRWSIKNSRFSANKSLYLANDTRYRHGCYGRRIGNRTQSFKRYQFQ